MITICQPGGGSGCDDLDDRSVHGLDEAVSDSWMVDGGDQ